MERGTVYAIENVAALLGIAAALTFAISFVNGFRSGDPTSWRIAKLSLQLGVVCAVLFVVLNIALRG